MVSAFFNAILYQPIYNGLIFLISFIPGGNVGAAIIILTAIVKLALFSFSFKSIQMQAKMREINPEIQKIKESHKNDRRKQTEAIMELYRSHNISPFASFLVAFVQIPVILALYLVFARGGLPEINSELVYGFISAPSVVNMNFLGAINLGEKSVPLAVIAGLAQFFQGRILTPKKKKSAASPGFQEDLAHTMQVQMRYFFPVLIGFFAYKLSAAIALYWSASAILTIFQEMYVRKRNKGAGL